MESKAFTKGLIFNY